MKSICFYEIYQLVILSQYVSKASDTHKTKKKIAMLMFLGWHLVQMFFLLWRVGNFCIFVYRKTVAMFSCQYESHKV